MHQMRTPYVLALTKESYSHKLISSTPLLFSSSSSASSSSMDYPATQTLNSDKTNSSKGGWKSSIFVIFVEVAERFAYYGVAGNLIMYLTNVVGESISTAAKNVNLWIGVAAIFPLVGGFLADSYLGRFKIILIANVVYLIGLLLLTLTVSVVPLPRRKATFFAGLYISAIGEGGHKPCVQTFAADQFDEETEEEKEVKSSFFNWWYLGIILGASSGTLVVIYLQDNVGWTLGFGLPAGAVAAALALFLMGTTTYRTEKPVGSPFTRVAQVFVASMRKRRANKNNQLGICMVDETCKTSSANGARIRTLEYTKQFRFLDNASFIDDLDAASKIRDPWRLCSVNQVEEVKLLFRLFPIWFSCMAFAITVAQSSTFFTKQASTMDRSIGSNFQVPPASMHVATGFTILVVVPVYDRFIVPLCRGVTGIPTGISLLQKMGVGLFFSILTMIVAALVETERIRIAKQYGLLDSPRATVPMRVWWLLPTYILGGFSDMFLYTALQELFYDQVPEKMRSVGAAAYVSTLGVGNLISSVLITVVQTISSRFGNEWLMNNLNRGHLDNFYWLLAGLSVLNLCYFIWVAKGFVYKKFQVKDESLDHP